MASSGIVCSARASLQVDVAGAVLTQLPPDRTWPHLVTGEVLDSFTVRTCDCSGAPFAFCKSWKLHVACKGLDPPEASFRIGLFGCATVEGDWLGRL